VFWSSDNIGQKPSACRLSTYLKKAHLLQNTRSRTLIFLKVLRSSKSCWVLQLRIKKLFLFKKIQNLVPLLFVSLSEPFLLNNTFVLRKCNFYDMVINNTIQPYLIFNKYHNLVQCRPYNS